MCPLDLTRARGSQGPHTDSNGLKFSVRAARADCTYRVVEQRAQYDLHVAKTRDAVRKDVSEPYVTSRTLSPGPWMMARGPIRRAGICTEESVHLCTQGHDKRGKTG